jgi:hypothetical protein
MRYRFMAAFGKKRTEPFDELHTVINEIVLAAGMLGRMWAREHFNDEKSREEHRLLVEKHESAIWYQGNKDEIVTRVNTIVEKMDNTCRQVILGIGTLHYFLNWKRR